MPDCTPQRITTSSDVIADLHDEIARLERELSHALQAADVEAREADRLRAHSAPREPLTEESLKRMHHEDQFGLFCDYDEFEQIARAIESAHGITAKKEQL